MLNNILSIFQKINLVINYLFKSETNEQKLFKQLLKNNNILVIDIGSNNGIFINKIEKYFKKNKIIIHSIEPIKELLENQNTNSADLIKHNYAITDFTGKTKLRITPLSSNSYIENNEIENFSFKENFKEIDIHTLTLSEFVKRNNIKKIDILKIDTEGYEFKILESSQDLLDKEIIKIIKLEINFLNYKKNNLIKISQLLNKFDYKMVGISNIKFKDNFLWFSDCYFVSESLLN